MTARVTGHKYGRAQGQGQIVIRSISGGDHPRSGPCEGLSRHGFLGKEGVAVAAIADWLQGKPVGEKIVP